ncbi:hypothetical protein LWI29_033187 [Acer saccharum]|uniref:Ubiquitin-like domain-containing protein n=1 Tax=Acer saccharum TaxID=4024 RepID=A0AA39RXZ4_ACESA|nr:hypothetical protein LWI29_033187 [Acer saccharum]
MSATGGGGGGGQEEDKKPMDQGAHINLKVKGQDGNEVFFRIKRSTQLRKLMTAYCDRQSVELNSIAFLFDGRRLRAEQTPDELEMEDGDEIDAMLHQTGGGLEIHKGAAQTDSLARSRLKGKEKVGEPSEPIALYHGTSSSRSVVNEPDNAPRDAETVREPLGAVALKILIPPESVVVPFSAGGGAELRHPDLDSEDSAADLNTCGR